MDKTKFEAVSKLLRTAAEESPDLNQTQLELIERAIGITDRLKVTLGAMGIDADHLGVLGLIFMAMAQVTYVAQERTERKGLPSPN